MSSRYFPGRVLGRFKGETSGRTPSVPHPLRLSGMTLRGRGHPGPHGWGTAWLGSHPRWARPGVGLKRGSFQKKMGRNFAASSQLDLRNPHCLVREGHGEPWKLSNVHSGNCLDGNIQFSSDVQSTHNSSRVISLKVICMHTCSPCPVPPSVHTWPKVEEAKDTRPL